MVRREELENMILTDLVAECQAKGIAVGDDPTADTLRDKLLGKKPAQPSEPTE